MTDPSLVFTGEPVALPEMLERREARAAEQQAALRRGCPCIISFCLNIPGPVKQFPLAKAAFEEGEAALLSALGDSFRPFTHISAVTGSEGIYLCDLPAQHVKRTVVSIEEEHPLGRLFDMDVLAPDRHLSRTEFSLPPRRCLLCGRDASLCARSRTHSVAELQQCIADMLESHFAEKAAQRTAAAAYKAMCDEISLTPKPGLVDLHDNGSHTDMDPELLFRSAQVLRPWFAELYLIGRSHPGGDPQTVFSLLQQTGFLAENDMLRATHGVNTHKGLLFSLALLCGAAGKLQAYTDSPLSAKRLTEEAAKFAKVCYSAFYGHANGSSRNPVCNEDGETVTDGARGEAARGFPSLIRVSLPEYVDTLAAGASKDYAASVALLALIGSVADTNMYRRGGIQQARFWSRQAQNMLTEITEANYKEILSRMNSQFVASNLSPGGSADLLAMTFFLYDICHGISDWNP